MCEEENGLWKYRLIIYFLLVIEHRLLAEMKLWDDILKNKNVWTTVPTMYTGHGHTDIVTAYVCMVPVRVLKCFL